MLPLRGTAVFCCDQPAAGRDAMATPETTVLSASRRVNVVIAGRVYRRTAGKENVFILKASIPHRRISMRRFLCLFLVVCSPALAQDATFRGNPQHTGV